MGSLSTWNERFDLLLRLLLPYGFILLLVMLNVLTLPEILQATVKLPLVLMAVYYWAIYRPTLLPVWSVFAIGIILDFVMGLPLGLNALSLVIAQWFIIDQRRFLIGQSFLILWLGFALICCAFSALQWVTFGLVKGLWVSVQPHLWSVLLGTCIFPIIYGLLHLTHKVLPFPPVASPYALKQQGRFKRTAK